MDRVPAGKGTLHIIADFGVEPRRYSELDGRISISNCPIADWVEEGIRLDAFQMERVVDEDGDRKVNRLSRGGERRST